MSIEGIDAERELGQMHRLYAVLKELDGAALKAQMELQELGGIYEKDGRHTRGVAPRVAARMAEAVQEARAEINKELALLIRGAMQDD